MTFSLPENSKFACLALENCSWNHDMPDEVQVSDNLWVLKASPFTIDAHWIEWLGTLNIDHFRKSDFLIVATAPSATLEILDGEHQALDQQVHALFYTLLMHGFPHYDGGMILQGSKYRDVTEVRSAGPLECYYRPHLVMPFQLNEEIVKNAATTANNLQNVFSPMGHYIRFKKGFDAWLKGGKEDRAHTRLHQFVRAIEAVMKPKIGATKRQFIHRGKVFAGTSEDTAKILEEAYDLRSSVEHMNDWELALPAYSEAEREEVASLRSYQMQLLSSDIYLRLLATPPTGSLIKDDATLEAFWKLPDDEKIKQWGKPFDLVGSPTGHFKPY